MNALDNICQKRPQLNIIFWDSQSGYGLRCLHIFPIWLSENEICMRVFALSKLFRTIIKVWIMFSFIFHTHWTSYKRQHFGLSESGPQDQFWAVLKAVFIWKFRCILSERLKAGFSTYELKETRRLLPRKRSHDWWYVLVLWFFSVYLFCIIYLFINLQMRREKEGQQSAIAIPATFGCFYSSFGPDIA